jgi:hypothetical protein
MFKNILSYFVRNIEDQIEKSYYKLKRDLNNYMFIITYKETAIYYISYDSIDSSFAVCDIKNNIFRYFDGSIIINNSFYKMKDSKAKYLYWKKDNKIQSDNYNMIGYSYKFINKCMNKTKIEYFIFNKIKLLFKSLYYNKHRYIYLSEKILVLSSYKSPKIYKQNQFIILIDNKYELHYINTFFTLLMNN